MKVFAGVLGLALWSGAQAGKLPAEPLEVPPLHGGVVGDGVLDMTLAVTPTLPYSEDDASARRGQDALIDGVNGGGAGGVSPKASTPLTCVGSPPVAYRPPNGWTITFAGMSSLCQPPWTAGYNSINITGTGLTYNQYIYTSYFDIPVGGTLRYCSAYGVPDGWQVIQVGLSSSCGASAGPDYVMQHVSCVAGRDTNCYPAPPPPSQTGSISASAQTVLVPYGQGFGSATVSWNSSGVASPCIWARNSGGIDQVWTCSGTGPNSDVWRYVPAGGSTTLWVSGAGSSAAQPNLAQVVIYGQAGAPAALSANPTSVQIPSGQYWGSTSVSYNLTGSGHDSACIWMANDGGAFQVWACEGGLSRTVVWPYIPKGGYTQIGLSSSQTVYSPIATPVTVFGN